MRLGNLFHSWRLARRPKVAKPASTRVSEWARTRLGFDADDVQRKILDAAAQPVILNCSRQWGKSTVGAAKALHTAATRAGSLVVAVSPSARQSGEFVRKTAGFARRVGERGRGDGQNEMSLLLKNGSRIVGLPGNEETVRGFSAVDLLLIDEAARVDDRLYQAVRPMLATTNGGLWLLSTPYGRRGFFYREWSEGGPGWLRVAAPAWDCARISREFLEQERAALGERAFRQEYECTFLERDDELLARELVEAALDEDVEPLVAL
jgi:hypothetical protein